MKKLTKTQKIIRKSRKPIRKLRKLRKPVKPRRPRRSKKIKKEKFILSSQLKNFILAPLLITGLIVFNLSTFSVLAEEGETNGTSTEQLLPVCGDGNLNDGEECDAGENNGVECIPEYGSSCNYCSVDCKNIELAGVYCGDGNLDDSEECDDGNTADGDGCSLSCTIEEISDPELEGDEEVLTEDGEAGEESVGDNEIITGDAGVEVIIENEANINIVEPDDCTCGCGCDCGEICGEDHLCQEDCPGEDCLGQENCQNPCQCDCEIEVENDNELEIDNNVLVEGETGENIIEDGTDDSLIDTGDVNLVVGVINTGNTNFIGSNFSNFLLNIFEGLNGTIDLSDQINLSTPSENCVSTISCFDFSNSNQGEIENNVLIDASSGSNSVDSQGEAVIKTGNVNVSANVVNILNSNVIGSNWTHFIINIFGDWMGDLVLPGKDAMQQFAGQNSWGCGGGDCGGYDINNSNEGQIQNEVDIVADTGNNVAEGNAAIIRTGAANAEANIFNVVNTNIKDHSLFFVGINQFGGWRGNVFSLPPGLEIAGEANGIKVYNLDSEEFNNGSAGSNLSVVNNNFGLIKNSVVVNVSTGNNIANSEGTAATIETGDANVAANLVNVLNSNITGNNMFLGMVNIFGNWQGNLAFGRPDLWLGESAITSPDPAQPGGSVTYTLTYKNNGDADATGVTITDDFDERYLSVIDPRGGVVIDNPGEIIWDIGTVLVGGSGSVSYDMAINSETFYGNTYITNTSLINSLENDWNEEDNTDSISFLVQGLSLPGPPTILFPDLQITKTHNGDEFVFAGDNIDYRIVLTNQGEGSAYDVVVYDNLYNDGEIINSYSWDLGEVFAHEEIIIDYQVAIGAEVPAGFYTNYAYAVGRGIQRDEISSPEASTVIEIRVPETPPEDETEGESEIEETEEISPPAEIKEELKGEEVSVSEILIPEVLAQEEIPPTDSLVTIANPSFMENFLAEIGSIFNLENIWWLLILLAVILIILFLLLRKRNKAI